MPRRREAGVEAGERRYDGVACVIPAFREAERVGAVVAAARAALPGVVVVVVDDGSRDGTAAAARAAGADAVCVLAFNLGYGAALETGYKWAVAHVDGLSAVVQCDADGQHDPRQLRDLLAALDEPPGADLVIGSRFAAGDGHYRAPAARRAGIRLFGRLVRATTGLRLTDPTSGFQALSADVVAHLAGGSMPWDFPDADLIIELHRAGFRIAEVPVTMAPRAGGESMHGGGVRALWYAFKVTLSVGVTVLRRPRRRPPPPPPEEI